MCGIAGCINSGATGTTFTELISMQSTLSHRGPDATAIEGWDSRGNPVLLNSLSLPCVALVHTRLSILDLTDAANQPMTSRDGRYVLVYNGEIYNYVELRTELTSRGHEFTTTGDTEVLLASYIEWGALALEKLVGMYAFVIFDRSARRIFAARDPFGIKPFYYSSASGRFAFASEIKALLKINWVRRVADPEALQRFLRFGGTDGDHHTMFRDAQQLPAGCYLEVALEQPEQVKVSRYFVLPEERLSEADISFDEAAKRVRDLFLESIALHMRSDVPIGSALSGGIDSSAIVGAMRHVGGAALDIHTFSYIATDEGLSEEPWMDLVNHAVGSTAHKIHISNATFLEDMDRAIASQDEPLSSTSLYAQFCLFRAAKQAGIKVMLDGQGADEILAGYGSYLGARLASLLRSRDFSQAVYLARSCRKDTGVSAFSLLQGTADHMLTPRQQAPLRRLAGKEMVPYWTNARWFASRVPGQPPPHYTSGRDVLSQSLRRDVTGTGLASLLRYEDRNSMASSVESRVPFLMPEFAQLLLSLPEKYLIDERGRSKAVFREAMRGLMPDAVVDRRDKLGFATPADSLLLVASERVRTEIRRSGIQQAGFLSPAGIERLLAHPGGKRGAGNAIWRLYFLAKWTEMHNVDYL